MIKIIFSRITFYPDTLGKRIQECFLANCYTFFMEAPPIFSTFTLITEIFVTAAVLFIFYQGYKHNKFFPKLVFFVLAYETLVNITYMSYRALTHTADVGPHHHTAFHIGVAIFHGVMAIIMFVALVVFF